MNSTSDLINDLRIEAYLCRNETEYELADLLNSAADEIERLLAELDALKK